MSVEIKALALDYSSSEAEVELRSLLGGLVGTDWRQALIGRGYGWHVNIGTLSTGITGGGAGTVLDADQPEFLLSVPTGYCLVPLRFAAQVRVGLQTTDSHVTEILFSVNSSVAWDGTSSSFVTETALNMRTNVTGASPITCASAFNGDITSPATSTFDLARKEALTDVQGTAATVNVYQMDLTYEPENPPFLIGPCCVQGYWGGSIATVGYAQLTFLAFASSLVSSLA